MRRYIGFFAVATVLVIIGTQPQQVLSKPEPDNASVSAEKPDFAPGRILVKPEENAPAGTVESLNRKNDARVEEKIPHSRVNVVDLPQDLSVTQAVKRYEASPDIEYAEPDFLVQPTVAPNDPSYAKLYGLNNTGQHGGTVGDDIHAQEAWDVTTGHAVVAVIDTGVDVNHPDLKDNIWTNTGEVAGNDKDDDNNGYKDDVHGWDFRNDDKSVFDADELSHGTHVAGTIAAEGNNGIGVTGVSWQAKVMPLKFIGPKTGYTSDAVEALNYAVDNGVKISSNSWGGGPYSQALLDALNKADAAGHLFVAAAGNDSADNDVTPHYPASYENPNVISVAASDPQDNIASFSNYGTTSVDLAAPGQWIYSTMPGNAYAYKSGTSMATPHVAGVAALVKSKYASLDDAQIKSRILDGVDKKAALADKVSTGGRLNAASAIGLATPVEPPPDSTKPTVSAISPTGSIRDRTPIVAATVRDNSNLAKSNIRFYLDGRQRGTFSYNSATDRLNYRSGRLSYGRHAVRIVARDAAGNVGYRYWTFRLVRR